MNGIYFFLSSVSNIFWYFKVSFDKKNWALMVALITGGING